MKNTLIMKCSAQLKREVLEYRWSFIYIPLFLSLLVTIFCLGFSFYWLFIRKEALGSEHTLNGTTLEFMYANTSLMLMVYFFALTNYLSSCLYDDRKSKQILFFRSMPVSESLNVMMKVVVAMIVIPTLLLLINEVVSLIGVVVGSIFFVALNDSSQIVFPALSDANVFVVPLQIYLDNLQGMFFVLPFIGYLLLISAWAKRFPMVIAFGVPMLLAFIDFLLGQVNLTIGVIDLLTLYGLWWAEIRSTFGLRVVFEFEWQHLMPLLKSVLIGGLLISASIWLRNNRCEI